MMSNIYGSGVIKAPPIDMNELARLERKQQSPD
jgi:hypothetical protein